MCVCVCVLQGNQALCSEGYELSGGQKGRTDDHVYHQRRSGEERSYVTISDVALNQSQSRLQPQTKIETVCLVLLCSCVSLLVWLLICFAMKLMSGGTFNCVVGPLHESKFYIS